MRVLDYKVSISTGETIQIVEIEYSPDLDPEVVDLCGRMPRAVLEEVKYGDDVQFRKLLSGSPDRNLIRSAKKLCAEDKYCSMKTPDCVPGKFRRGLSVLPQCYTTPDEFFFTCMHAWREGKYVIIVDG